MSIESVVTDDIDDTVNYPPPNGLQKRRGVEYGCADASCSECYTPTEPENIHGGGK